MHAWSAFTYCNHLELSRFVLSRFLWQYLQCLSRTQVVASAWPPESSYLMRATKFAGVVSTLVIIVCDRICTSNRHCTGTRSSSTCAHVQWLGLPYIVQNMPATAAAITTVHSQPQNARERVMRSLPMT